MQEVFPSRSTTGWQPLARGGFADETLEIIQAIARQLRGWTPPPNEDRPPGSSACVASGYAGLALFFAYLALSKLDDSASEIAVGFLEKAMDRVAEEAMNPSLYAGFTGVAWTTSHLQRHLFGSETDDTNDAIDEALGRYLTESPWTGDFDLINGIVGFGIYALERLPQPAAVGLLERIVDCLEESARRESPGLTWWTNPAWLPPQTRVKYPKGYFNLGVAHGTPGVIGLLGAIYAAGVNAAKAKRIVTAAVDWLLSQEYRDDEWVGFPPWIEVGARPEKNRLAWCYGDLGIAVALLGTARSVGNPAWEEKALAVAQRAARCPLDRSCVLDAGLCHGAAGVGHLFNRLYQATGDATFAEAARFWFSQALTLREPERGIAGFAAWWSNEEGHAKWVNEPGFLMGAAGIGLALMAAVTPLEPLWDRLLGVALPPAAHTS